MADVAPGDPLDLDADAGEKGQPEKPDEKPKKARRTRKRTTRRAAPVIDIKAGMAEFYGSVAMLLMLFNADDAEVILNRADAAATACAQLAEQSPAARRILEGLCQSTAIGTLVAVHAGMAVGIMANHGMIGADIAKLLAPDAAGVQSSNGDSGSDVTDPGGSGTPAVAVVP